MEPSEGFNDGTNRVCLLKCSRYGLKHASKCWNKRIGNLTWFQVKRCRQLFIREKGGKKLILVLNADVGLVAASGKVELKDFLISLKSKFKIVSENATYFLGREIKNCDDKNKISLGMSPRFNTDEKHS